MTIETSLTQGASFPAFANHPGYSRMFAPGRLTMGIFLPLRFYQGDMSVLAGQAALVEEIDRQDFAAVWVRDVPLYDPNFGDAGQVSWCWVLLPGTGRWSFPPTAWSGPNGQSVLRRLSATSVS